MKENDYHNIHMKYQVHGTNILELGTKAIGRNFDSIPYPYLMVAWNIFSR